jgi:dihydrolipoamide dehydrogenase
VAQVRPDPWYGLALVDSDHAPEMPDVPLRSTEPVAEEHRFCANPVCGKPVGRGYAGEPGRTTGFCPYADLVKPLHAHLDERCEAILLSTKVASAEATKKGIEVTFEGENAPDCQAFDRVLMAVGRRANGDHLGLDKAGVEVDERGEIPVDAKRRTNVGHIYAIGDIAGGPMLAHKASHEGKVAAEVIAGNDVTFEPMAIPSVAYTDPEVAWTGLTETDAVDSGADYEKSTFPWQASGRALGLARPDGMTKLLLDPESRRVLGAGVVGVNAGDLIAEATLAIEMAADAEDLGLTVHPHPTLSETLMMAAEKAEGTITDLYAPKRR